jgi:hypothetical protein
MVCGSDSDKKVKSNRTFSTSKVKFLHFFMFLGVISAVLNPDPDSQSESDPQTQLNPDRSETLDPILITEKLKQFCFSFMC